MKSLSKFLSGTLTLTLIFLLLSLVHARAAVGSGGFLFSSSPKYVLGFPVPSLYWSLESSDLALLGESEKGGNTGGIVSDASDWIISANVSILDLPRLLLAGESSATFRVFPSLVGVTLNFIFWFGVSCVMLMTWSKFVKMYKKEIAVKISLIVILTSALTVLVPTWTDPSYNMVIARGAPMAFLERLHSYGEDWGYSTQYYLKPFLFVVNTLILWEITAIFAIARKKIVERARKRKH